MPVWSSPFPCTTPLGWDPGVSFPGPKGSLLLFDSPDRVLLTWSRHQQCEGSELERIQKGCLDLIELRDQGEHMVQPCWGNEASAPQPDGILASLLLRLLEASPDVFEAYLQLDPQYIYRLIRTQHSPRQILRQYLQNKDYGIQADQPMQRQLKAALNELKQRQNEQIRVETLLEQHRDQQQRTRRLINKMLKDELNC